MIALGSFFNQDQRFESIKRQLKSGVVIKLYQSMDDGLKHEKRFILLSVSETELACAVVINSTISNFVKRNPDINKCQLSVIASDCNFLDHDSFIDCSRIRKFDYKDIVQQLDGNPSWILGKIDKSLTGSVLNALKHSIFISVSEIEKVQKCMQDDSGCA